ncbi:MAG: hypothetical protein Q8K36_04285, partial [Alphaproteobacteria bacterium]|nr:hypothetical protein [Alphaproteobacteria bacterium]
MKIALTKNIDLTRSINLCLIKSFGLSLILMNHGFSSNDPFDVSHVYERPHAEPIQKGQTLSVAAQDDLMTQDQFIEKLKVGLTSEQINLIQFAVQHFTLQNCSPKFLGRLAHLIMPNMLLNDRLYILQTFIPSETPAINPETLLTDLEVVLVYKPTRKPSDILYLIQFLQSLNPDANALALRLINTLGPDFNEIDLDLLSRIKDIGFNKKELLHQYMDVTYLKSKYIARRTAGNLPYNAISTEPMAIDQENWLSEPEYNWIQKILETMQENAQKGEA